MEAYDPYAPEVLEDPARAHAWLRANAPVHRYDGFDPPFYTLSRHADVHAALLDNETFSAEYGQGPRFTTAGGMLSDPPTHTRFRRLVQKAFTPGAIARLAPYIESLSYALIDAVRGRGSCDLHDDFAFPLPVIVISEMLGVSPDDREQFKVWSDASVAAMGARDEAEADSVYLELGGYLAGEIGWRREKLAGAAGDDGRDPLGTVLPDDLISGLLVASDGGEHLTTEDMVGVLVQLLVGGNETTTSLITNAVLRLLERPAHWAELVAHPEKIELAVEESLRFDPPVLGLFRSTTRRVRLHGVEIPAGAKVMLLYASANRDPVAFDDPDTFRLDRDIATVRRHLSFGLGTHFCLGAPMARLEANIGLRVLTERLPDLRLAGRSERITPFFLFGRKTLPVAWG